MQRLKQEGKMNVEIMKIIISKKKTTSPSLRNHELRTVKSKTEKVNNLLTNILTNNIRYVNDLIYAGAKLVCDKTTTPSEDHRQKSKTRMGTIIWITDMKSTRTSNNTKTGHENIFGRSGKETTIRMKNTTRRDKLKILVKEGKLKRYRDRAK